jgi:hypothetical protein
MKSILIFFLAFIFFNSVYAQLPDSVSVEQSDTLETIISDTSIIYVIQAAPVTIREKVEILLPKNKKTYYQSIYFSLLKFSEYKKARSSYEDYLLNVNAATSNTLSYSVGTSIWQCPQKIYTGIGIEFIRLKQRFQYTDFANISYTAGNRFNYISGGIDLGYWLKKDKKISCIIYGKIHGQYLVSYTGFTLEKTNLSIAQRINLETKYQPYLVDFSLNFKFLFTLKTVFLEAEPYCSFLPLSATQKDEAFSVKRTFIGIKLGFAQKLF